MLAASVAYLVNWRLSERQAVEISRLVSHLEGLARTDPLTGVPNRRVWEEELPRELERARRTGTGVCLAMIDLDNFKAYNDRHGHQAGDLVLKEAASAWRAEMRSTDLLGPLPGQGRGPQPLHPRLLTGRGGRAPGLLRLGWGCGQRDASSAWGGCGQRGAPFPAVGYPPVRGPQHPGVGTARPLPAARSAPARRDPPLVHTPAQPLLGHPDRPSLLYTPTDPPVDRCAPGGHQCGEAE